MNKPVRLWTDQQIQGLCEAAYLICNPKILKGMDNLTDEKISARIKECSENGYHLTDEGKKNALTEEQLKELILGCITHEGCNS